MIAYPVFTGCKVSMHLGFGCQTLTCSLVRDRLTLAPVTTNASTPRNQRVRNRPDYVVRGAIGLPVP